MPRFNVDKATMDMEILRNQMAQVKKSRKYHQLITGSLKKMETRKALFQVEGDLAYIMVVDPDRATKKTGRTNPFKENLLTAIEIVLDGYEKESTGKDKWLVIKDGKKTEISIVCHRTEQDAGGIGSFGTGKTLNSQLSKAVYEQLKQFDNSEIMEVNSNRIMVATDKNPISIKFTNKR